MGNLKAPKEDFFRILAWLSSLALAGLWLYGPWERNAQNYDWMLGPVAAFLGAFLNEPPIPHPRGYLFPSALLSIRCVGIRFSAILIAISGFYFSPILNSLKRRFQFSSKKQKRFLPWSMLFLFVLLLFFFFICIYVWNLLITSSRILIQILLAPQADFFQTLYNFSGAFFYLSGAFFYAIFLSSILKNTKRIINTK